MKTMQDYINYCTEEQTLRAFKLGVPIEDNPMYRYEYDKLPKYKHRNEFDIEVFSYIPTTQQMIGWLEENGVYIEIYKEGVFGFSINNITGVGTFTTRAQAELAAIDAALDRLD